MRFALKSNQGLKSKTDARFFRSGGQERESGQVVLKLSLVRLVILSRLRVANIIAHLKRDENTF